jgi:protein O-mannosyl-transferase
LGKGGGETWAVVIGISDYQEKNIALRYAHRDAEAFADWLRSPSGGGLDSDHLYLLLNHHATAGRVAEVLDGLVQYVQENDVVFIYFSGHGDVARTYSQPGFLLCWDAPERIYMSGGTYSISNLQEITTTLTLQNKAKVILVADACRSGKLAGSEIGGPRLTAAKLMERQDKETKILSCQPHEVSIEGLQWGGGRGAFSYRLMEGLYGFADQDGDGIVSFRELERYLEDNVSADVAPESQNPILITSDKSAIISSVHEKTIADLRLKKSFERPAFSQGKSRGIEEEILDQLDRGITKMYHSFKSAIAQKRFFPDSEGADSLSSADELYTQLLQEPGLGYLKGAMTRHYAAALQDETQLIINEWLETPVKFFFETDIGVVAAQKNISPKFLSYPRYLQRASELLGEKHYFHASLEARRYFFEGFLLARSNRNPNKDLGERALQLFRKSLEWQTESPHVLWQMSLVFGWNLDQPDSLEYYAQMALDAHPNWDLPCIDAAFILSSKYGRHERARQFLQLAQRIDSTSAAQWSTMAVVHFGEGDFDQAERILWHALSLDSLDAGIWNNLGYLLNKTGQHEEAKAIFEKALAIDSSQVNAWINLGIACNLGGRYQESIGANSRAILLDSTIALAWSNLATLYLRLGRTGEAEHALIKSITLDSSQSLAWRHLGMVYNNLYRYDEAAFVLQQSIDLNPDDIDAWEELGYAMIQIHRYRDAESVLSNAIRRDSSQASLWANLGYVFLKTGRIDEAEVVLEKAVSLDSTKADVWINLGELHMETRRYGSAKRVLSRATALNPSNPLAWHSLAIACMHNRQFPEAEAMLRNALVLDPYLYRAWVSLGAMYYETGQYDKAESMYIIANTIDSTSFICHRQLGMVYFKIGLPQDARYHLGKALQLNPGYIQGLLSMACLLSSTGETSEALNFVEQAIARGTGFDALQAEGDLAPLKVLNAWKLLMHRHFPEHGH